jgi:hypothetical protein
MTMKLSAETLEILKNFASANPNIILHPGNVVRTRASDKSFFAEATIAESFEKRVVIYNFTGFLGALSLFKDSQPDLNFGDTHVEITDGKQRIDYTLGAESEAKIAAAPDKTPSFPQPDVEFDLPYADLKKAVTATQILELDEMAVQVEDGKVYLRGVDRKNSAKNLYSAHVADAEGAADRIHYIPKKAIVMLPRDYRVGLHRRATRWASSNLIYWTANGKED